MENGLSKQEIEYRINNNLINNEQVSYSRDIKTIILSNTISIFNLVNIVLFVLVLTTGSFQNAGFIGIIFINTVIAIIQEINSKKVIDNLKIANQAKIKVKREGKVIEITQEEILLDDLLVLSSGDQIVVDSLIIKSNMCEVDESIITGESNSILKKKDDKLISGSVIISGDCLAKVISINKDNYASSLVKEASSIEDNSSYLKNSVNRILKIITIVIVPTAVFLFISQYFYSGQTYSEAILSTVAGIIGMIPEGLVLLTSIALTVGVIAMARKKVIIQKLSGIENLACIDILCLDKTGTITDGSMKVIDTICLEKNSIDNIIANMINNPVNATDIALKKQYKVSKELKIKDQLPFSSYRKYSAVTFEDNKTYYIGAFEYLTTESIDKYNKYIEKYVDSGYRIITIASSNKVIEKEKPKNIKIIGFIILKDNIRKNAEETLKYFREQGVKLKIISGDNPKTVSNIMKQIDFENYDKYIEGSQLPSDYLELVKIVNNYTIFGRVTPNQKQNIIKALKENNKVGYVGDGVNDILALKEANCGIALASGISAARSVAEIVLTESDFGVMPDIVYQGRKVVNNIERVASMYLIKTTYSFILSILSIILSHEYPFYPIQLSLISGICVGIPSFFLALEPNFNKVKPGFIRKVFRNALPSGLCVFVNIFLIIMICEIFKFDFNNWRIVIVCCTGLINLRLLYMISRPLTFIRQLIVVGCTISFFEALILFPNFFLIGKFGILSILFIALFAFADTYVVEFLEELYDKFFMKRWLQKND